MIYKHVLRAVHEIALMAGLSIIWIAKVNGQSHLPTHGYTIARPATVSRPS
jgi:hypothetical protein